MKNACRLLVIALVLIFTIASIGACDSVISVTLYFDSNDGTEVEPITTNGNSIITIPKNPTKEGYAFGGWFWDDGTFLQQLTVNSLLDSPIQSDMTVYAKWIPEGEEPIIEDTYTITFNTNGGSDIAALIIEEGVTIVIPTNPIKAGNTFDGWYSNIGTTTAYTFSTMPAEDITLYAKWNINQYTMSFNSNEGTAVNEIIQNYNTEVTAPTAPSRIGYTFSGWYSNVGLTTAYTFSTMPTENITLYAKWTIISYEISYDTDGGINNESNPSSYTIINEEITILAATKEGYIFNGWYEEDMTTPADTTIEAGSTGNVSYYAKWSLNQYTITFNSNGGSSVLQITEAKDTTIAAPIAPTKTGYSFVCWCIDDELINAYTFSTMPANNITLYAKWTILSYTITFDSNDGSSVTAITEDYNTIVASPTAPTKTGYIFSNWYTDVELTNNYTFSTMGATDIILYAKWTINQYSISFNSNGGSEVAIVIQDYNTAVTAPTQPIKTGYIFSSWYIDSELSNLYTFNTMLIENITLYAKWTVLQYTISFNSNDGSEVEAITEDYNTVVSAPIEPTKTEYTFNGWYSNVQLTNLYTFNTMPAEDITLYAKWIINQYSISFNSNGGSAVTTITRNYGATVSAPTNPTKAGLSFAGWYLEAELINYYTFTTMGNSNIILYADWGTSGLLYTPINNNTEYSVSKESAGTETSIIIPNRYAGKLITQIGDDGFSACSSLANIQISNYITSIGSAAFMGTVISEITLPSSVTSIGNSAFRGCNLLSIIIPESVTSMGNQVFLGCNKLASIVISSNISVIGTSVFANCSSLTSIEISKNITSIGSATFWGCSKLASISVDEENEVYSSVDGILFNYAKTALIVYPAGKTESSYVIPSNVTNISEAAFTSCASLSDITIPFVGASATATGTQGVFGYIWGTNPYTGSSSTKQYYASGLYTTYYLPSNLNTVTIAGGTTINYGAFNACKTISSISISDTITSIGPFAFYDCINLESVYVNRRASDGPTTGEISMFDNCHSSLEIYIPSDSLAVYQGMAYWSNYLAKLIALHLISFDTNGGSSVAIIKARNNTSISAPTVPTKAGYTFSAWYTDVTLNNPYDFNQLVTTNMVLYADWGTGGLSYTLINADTEYSVAIGSASPTGDIVIPKFYNGKLVTAITAQAFYNRNISSVIIPDSIINIGNKAFEECDFLTSIIIPDSVITIGDRAFYNCIMLNSIDISNSVETIGDAAFLLCTSLTSITIPFSVTSLGAWAFAYANNLTNITILANLSSIGSGTFYNCNLLTNINIPVNVETIGSEAFYGCSALVSITIPTLVTSIGDYAFRSCSSLTSITIPESVTIIGESAFTDCSNLLTVYVLRNTTSGATTGGMGMFSGTHIDLIIYVPDAGSQAAYQGMENWSTYLNKIYVLP